MHMLSLCKIAMYAHWGELTSYGGLLSSSNKT